MYKKFSQEEITTIAGKVEELISFRSALYQNNSVHGIHFSVSGTTVSGTVGSGSYFATMYDFQSEPKNKLATVAFGVSLSSAFCSTIAYDLEAKKRIYRMYAKKLLGSENRVFKVDDKPANELLFISISRNQMKDGLVPGIFYAGFLSSSNSIHPTHSAAPVRLMGDFTSKTPILYDHGGTYREINAQIAHGYKETSITPCGLVFYQQGIAAIIPEIAFETGSNGMDPLRRTYSDLVNNFSTNEVHQGFINKLSDVVFKNQSVPGVSVFNCTMGETEFCYSTNPSYRNQNNELISTSGSMESFACVTQVGLLNEIGEVIAVGKLSEPIKKSWGEKISIKVRLVI